MLKRILAATAVLAFCSVPLAAQEMGGMHHTGKDVSMTGQVIDLSCFTTSGASGAGHKACATGCAKSGMPLAILGDDGKIYLPASAKPADAQNSRLLPFAEQKVKLTGSVLESHGVNMITIKTIAAAS
ncbi:MAG TPA: hypothetical protein VFU41_04300 [Gemmatimonadales bacterium]|nr:hypothetical protein [Gemmatimonadales bacterium]